MLAIVAGAAQSMPKYGIGRAEFEIQRLPWMVDI
jgi:hypothetical protein